MQQMSVLKSRRWRYGDGLCERLIGLLGAIRNRGLLTIVVGDGVSIMHNLAIGAGLRKAEANEFAARYAA